MAGNVIQEDNFECGVEDEEFEDGVAGSLLVNDSYAQSVSDAGDESSPEEEEIIYHASQSNEAGQDDAENNGGAQKYGTAAHLSTIAEESQIAEDSHISSPQKSKVRNLSFSRAFGNTEEISKHQASEVFTSAEFVRGGGSQMQKHEESFLRGRVLDKNDIRFDRTHQEKENSWEPSVHDSPPPLPLIHKTTLLDKLNTNSELSIGTGLCSKKDEEAEPIVEGKENVSKDVTGVSVMNDFSPAVDGPKVSTPNAESVPRRRTLQESLNFEDVSAILPPNNISARHRDKPMDVSKNVEHENSPQDTLTSSAIDAVLASSYLNDTALVNALQKARASKHNDLKSMFPSRRLTGKKSMSGFGGFAGSSRSRSQHHTEKSLSDGISKGKDKSRAKVGAGGDSLLRSEGVSAECLSSRKDSSDGKLKSQREIYSLEDVHSATKDSGNTASARGSCSGPMVDDKKRAVLTFKPACVHFGFVDVNERTHEKILIRNITDTKREISVGLTSTKHFKLAEQGRFTLAPQESHYIHISFHPNLTARFITRLRVRVYNPEPISYSIPIEGSGGTAALVIQQKRNDVDRLSDGTFVVNVQGKAGVKFDVKNDGDRDAFARVVVRERKSGKQINSAHILPSDCVTILRGQTQKFEVHVEMDASANPSSSHTSSTWSIASGSSASPYTIQLLWGQEVQRRRLKRLEEMKMANYMVKGFSFTKPAFLNEEKSKEAEKRMMAQNDPPKKIDLEVFDVGLRAINISVVDNRLSMAFDRFSDVSYSETVLLDPDAFLDETFADQTVVQDVTLVDKRR